MINDFLTFGGHFFFFCCLNFSDLIHGRHFDGRTVQFDFVCVHGRVGNQNGGVLHTFWLPDRCRRHHFQRLQSPRCERAAILRQWYSGDMAERRARTWRWATEKCKRKCVCTGLRMGERMRWQIFVFINCLWWREREPKLCSRLGTNPDPPNVVCNRSSWIPLATN